ncbi:serpin family protein [Mucilaginibacter ginsenosidivorans]|uniref:Serpin family protein n=1 Tax=Mucilaginibacter ginsenosidivorans TaxID=398053 RepID=A0A5B8UVV2_9SPHI|nr:serpin family protein [Mucilaginibacter ginsenosidivorans]QEC63250.1 serpin family protein [Mucilaginibacter ginsenosidivorans]
MKRVLLPLSLVAVLFVIASCKKDSKKPSPDTGINLSLNATEQQQAAGDNAFTFNLFKTVAASSTNGTNLFISPLSVSMALGMTANGANGQTLTDMRSTLGFNDFSEDQVNSYYNKLVTQLPQLDPNTTLKIANSIWYDKKFSVLPQFIKTDSTYFNARVQSLDFKAPASVTTINDWVSNQTNGKIKELLQEISDDEVMFLVNAIYFKSTWKSKFDPANTRKLPFYNDGTNSVQADFMQDDISYNAYTDNNVQLIELPYSNEKYSMVIALPNENKTLADLIPMLNSDNWNDWVSKLSPTKRSIYIPKFTFTYSVNLNSTLTNLGMGVAFTKAADFTRINPAGNLLITKVLHKAYVGVDESGTEAAGATSVGVGTTTAQQPMLVNKPFVFVIREMKTGLILFTGTVNDPTQSGL